MRLDAVLVTVVARGLAVCVSSQYGRPVTAWRDHKVDVHLSPCDRLQRLLDETGEAILQPVLGQLAWYSDAERAAVGRHNRSVLEPHVVGTFSELKPELLLDLRPDLVLVHLLISPSLFPGRERSVGSKSRPPQGGGGRCKCCGQA